MEDESLTQVWGLPCACCRAQIALHSKPQLLEEESIPPPPPRFEGSSLSDLVEAQESAGRGISEDQHDGSIQDASQLKPCRHFARTGNCLYGDACRFSHEARLPTGGEEIPKRAWGGKRRLVRKCGKAGAFRRFLLDTFGQDVLTQGEGVLDVAGGNGELAFLLVNLNGVRTTVVDPRPLRIDRFARKLRWGVYHGTEPLQGFNTEQLPADGSARVPGHLRAFLDDAFIDPLIADDMPGFQEALYNTSCRAAKVDWTSKGIEARVDGDENDEAIKDLDHSEDWQGPPPVEDVLRVLREASCIVGLHPDQAAGAALDLAIALGKPAAIVPCCVYAIEFPTRRLACGRQVRHPADLVEWLLAKDPRLQETTLPFEGRNRVVYFDPKK